VNCINALGKVVAPSLQQLCQLLPFGLAEFFSKKTEETMGTHRDTETLPVHTCRKQRKKAQIIIVKM
jgi:hypothetical protein